MEYIITSGMVVVFDAYGPTDNGWRLKWPSQKMLEKQS